MALKVSFREFGGNMVLILLHYSQCQGTQNAAHIQWGLGQEKAQQWTLCDSQVPPLFWQWWWWFSCCHVQLFATPWTVSPLGSSIRGISQAGIPEWVAISFSRGSSQPRDPNCISCNGGRLLHCRQILYWLSDEESFHFGHSIHQIQWCLKWQWQRDAVFSLWQAIISESQLGFLGFQRKALPSSA